MIPQPPLIGPAAWLSGYIPDLPTPFNEDRSVDLNAFARLCTRHIAAGVPAILVTETAGEASTLSTAERETLIRLAVELSRGRIAVIAGAGSNSTERAIELTELAEKAGADAVMSVVPYYNKPMQSGIHSHFRAIADSATLPIVIHDIPSRTARELADETLVRLSESEQFIGLRDGSSDITRVARLRSRLPSTFRLLSSDDSTTLAFLASGADGVVSLVSNVTPDLCEVIFASCRQGRWQAARHLKKRLAPLETCLSQECPAALKYALSLMDLMRPDVRLPLVKKDMAASGGVRRAFDSLSAEDLAVVTEA